MTRLWALVLVLLMAWGAVPCPVMASPGLDQALFEQALQASRNGDIAEALPLWNRYLDAHPGDAAALSNRGNVRLVLGDAEGAIRDQSRSIELSPDEIDPHLNRGTAEEALQAVARQLAVVLNLVGRHPHAASVRKAAQLREILAHDARLPRRRLQRWRR